MRPGEVAGASAAMTSLMRCADPISSPLLALTRIASGRRWGRMAATLARIVCAGGTSLIGGFIDVFRDEFESIKFPIQVKNIRLAEDPLFSVSKGCLVAALSDI